METPVKVVLVALFVLALASLAIFGLLAARAGGGSDTQTGSGYPPYGDLPSGCVKPKGGYLIIVNGNGYNDSKQHGAPASAYPTISVVEGTTVNITICNDDTQSHGFQISTYFVSTLESITPGHVVHLSFVADKTGDFDIYCAIWCYSHIYMRGTLVVTA